MINEVDYDKYIVIKTKDLQYLNKDEQKYFTESLRKIDCLRMEKENKNINNYLVLNTDDNFSLTYLFQRLALLNEKMRFNYEYRKKLKIKDISIDLINSILNYNHKKL